MRNGTVHFRKMRTHTDLIQSMCKHHFFFKFHSHFFFRSLCLINQTLVISKITLIAKMCLLLFFFLPLFRSLCVCVCTSNSVTVYKATWVRRAIRSRSLAWIIRARVEVNALKRMANGSVDATHGGKAHGARDV